MQIKSRGRNRLDGTCKGSYIVRNYDNTINYLIIYQMSFFSKYSKSQFQVIDEQQVADTKEIVSATSPSWNAQGSPLRFSLTLGPSQGIDQSCIWSITTPIPYRPSLDMAMSFQNGQKIVMTNVATNSSYPTNIYVAIDNFPGYYDINGNQTGRVCMYELSSILTVGSTPTYTIQYESLGTVWYLSRNQGQLNFRIFYDDNTTPQQVPLPFQLPLQFEFRRYPYEKGLQVASCKSGIELLTSQMMILS